MASGQCGPLTLDICGEADPDIQNLDRHTFGTFGCHTNHPANQSSQKSQIKPAKNSPRTPNSNNEPIGDKVINTDIYRNIEIATNSSRPNRSVVRKRIKVVKLGGSVRLYGSGKKKATIRMGKQRNKALERRCASSFAYQKP